MPEYLAPGVYVEEIDTGSKPIEGVSTSTAGMLGVTERGPVNVPILITSVGEYTRWFGGRLNIKDFNGHCYLPHAVEGFFTNGGKRVYLVRVLNQSQAERAKAFIFSSGADKPFNTSLLVRTTSNSNTINVLGGGALAVDQWLQIGRGSAAQYLKISASPGAAHQVPLVTPLGKPHKSGTEVKHLAPLDSEGTPVNLTEPCDLGAESITVSTIANFTDGDLICVGDSTKGDDEYVFIGTPANNQIPLRTPLMLHHEKGNDLVKKMKDPEEGDRATQIDANSPTVAGDLVVLLGSSAGYEPNGYIRINDGNNTEIRKIGKLAQLPLSTAAYSGYPAGSLVELVQMTDTGDGFSLTADVAQGSNVITVDKRSAEIKVGDVVKVGLDDEAEYVTVAAIPSILPPPNPGKLILKTRLQRSHNAPGQVKKQTLQVQTGLAFLALQAEPGADRLGVTRSIGAANGVVRITPPTGNAHFYHQLAAVPVDITPTLLTVSEPLLTSWPPGTPVAARDIPLFKVSALDAGAWGKRLQVSVQDHDPPLLKTTLWEDPTDSTHIRLTSVNGVEVGTVLEVADSLGNKTLVKVARIERENNYLIGIGQALPAAVKKGDAVRSVEFQLDVYLRRQPDPANPTRNDAIIDVESFRYLSLDPRHSRYIQKVIGTTWDDVPGTTHDHADLALRRADRRSEGESIYIRVEDQASTDDDKQKIRNNPDPLSEILPDGRKRSGRCSLMGGGDAVDSIDDDTYKGVDDPNPEQRTGLHSLRNIEEISIIACPGRYSTALQGALISHCELMRYRFAVLDGPAPPKDNLADVQNQRQQFDTKYAALYHPWLLIPDPYPTNPAQPAEYPIPPSGHMLGVYARTDIERGVHKAPANEVVRGIIGLQRLLNKEQHDILNPYPVNINVIRDFRDNNRGIRVYGGRVITSDSDWKYVNVRRLLIFIEASIDRGLQWVVFEPNAEPLWARVRRSISNFLTLVWRNGALEGTKVEEAFFVKCDRTTMTQTDIDSGRLIVVVGVAPVKPAEFVIVRIGLWTAHAED